MAGSAGSDDVFHLYTVERQDDGAATGEASGATGRVLPPPRRSATFQTTSTTAIAVEPQPHHHRHHRHRHRHHRRSGAEGPHAEEATPGTASPPQTSSLHAVLLRMTDVLQAGDQVLLGVALEARRYMLVIASGANDSRAAIVGLRHDQGQDAFDIEAVVPIHRCGDLRLSGNGGFHFTPSPSGNIK